MKITPLKLGGVVFLLYLCKEHIKQYNIMAKLLTVLVNGDWDTSIEDRVNKDVIIYDEGEKHLVSIEVYDKFLDSLEKFGYDCYLCLENYSHPEWNGIFKYIKL